MTRRMIFERRIGRLKVEVRHDEDDIGRPDLAYIGRDIARDLWGFVSFGPLTLTLKWRPSPS